MIFHKNLKIYGNVQNVNFRYFAKNSADKLGVVGFARNEKDGTIYIEAEGEEKSLKEFVKYCEIGPEASQVKHIEIIGTAIIKSKKFINFYY